MRNFLTCYLHNKIKNKSYLYAVCPIKYSTYILSTLMYRMRTYMNQFTCICSIEEI